MICALIGPSQQSREDVFAVVIDGNIGAVEHSLILQCQGQWLKIPFSLVYITRSDKSLFRQQLWNWTSHQGLLVDSFWRSTMRLLDLFLVKPSSLTSAIQAAMFRANPACGFETGPHCLTGTMQTDSEIIGSDVEVLRHRLDWFAL